jgi:Rps23 Pro-64 3,4-dihydroxylase Tpa1-like proline 4-hydroxylase
MNVTIKGKYKGKYGDQTDKIAVVKAGITLSDDGCFLTFHDLKVSEKLRRVFKEAS